MTALTITGLSKTFGTVRAVQDVSLEVAAGETLTLLGPSGCGKSTVLRCVAGLERPDTGRIEMAGRDVTERPPEARHVGLVFQDYALFPHLSVLENVAYGPRRRGAPRAVAGARAREVLALVGLPGMERRSPAQLSGGQQQRVALARALATDAGLLLLDEPLSNLDEQRRDELRSDLRALFGRVGAGVLLVTHDQREALALSDRVAVMRAGQIVQQGAAHDVFARPESAWVAAFLGWANILSGGPDRARLVPEAAVRVGMGAAVPVTAQQPTERGRTVTVAHPLGPLTLHLSARESALIDGNTLRLDVNLTSLLDVPDDRAVPPHAGAGGP
ncbi:ABC-type Fe3+/spermidine/putrescine transport system ATPase subunit [Deinococcus metalli]|uniref:ABC transporter ATP-binding protein n=1 Tax=Deinococcus metalli TaxID=1141878 RepID=A0A7W8KHC2_9DEIO|nr:ABC transporter ATP-binding protein [Deinococcus metalli]MBB5377925.1 ABC-type Fe3+/spermidine/putrescine transport system ATPase subunit [Deinococcus metalli]GHF55069.1 ABC transporter ATP-binding protein [Deinococcus metalli]